MIEIELRIEVLATERRWNRLRAFETEFQPLHARIGTGKILGKFISYRDDDTFVWLHGFRDREERLASQERLWSQVQPAPTVRSTTRILAPAVGSTIERLDDFAPIAESSVIEIRQYRLAPGVRREFAQFLRDRTVDEQRRCGMVFHGPFDDLGDENVLTWLRGFPSLLDRDRMKADFYQGRLWLDELEAIAMPMIEDYSNTLLVTPV